ncbi:Glycosyltransferase buaB [Paramyrothecium foliicola]|nr:Glycosyltransferase buaB [Paramyrothecium foliicola]
MSPWSHEDHWLLYKQISDLILKIDPTVVVLDPMFRPAVDAARNLDRLRAILCPNALTDDFLYAQSHGAVFWKYPV